MITHRIEVHKAPAYAVVPHQAQAWNNISKPMGKLEFAQFVKSLDVKVGDLVAYNNCSRPLSEHQCNMVVDIDEIHKFVDWGTETSGPKIYELASYARLKAPNMHQANRSPTWKGGTNNWVRVDPEDYPVAWKEYMATLKKHK